MSVRQLHVGLLGPFEVRLEGQPTGPAGARRRGLLALLALEANTVVSVDALIDRMWAEQPPSSAVNVIQTYVSAWRKAFAAMPGTGGSPLVTVGAGYRLDLAVGESDLLTFRSLIARGRRAALDGNLAEAAVRYGEALALWRGPALVDLSREPFHGRPADDLEAERLLVAESWATATLRSGGDPAGVVETLTEIRAREPLRETLTELLMWALTASGRQAAAVEAFTVTRRLLRDELGADPGPSLAAMHERVLHGDPGLQVTLQAARVRSASPLPEAKKRVDSFVGRTCEMEEVAALLQAHRLVTLTGPGGSGKTRLALEVLAQRTTASEPGWFVELAPLRDGALTAATIAAALGIQTAAGTDPLGALTAHLSEMSGLLVLDNLEHLADVHVVVDQLHRGTRYLRLLVTSREPVRLEGEQQYVVRLLAVPEPNAADDVDHLRQVDSVRLLVDRARANDPSFAISAENAGDIAEITRRLDGLPLAVEIVAPWLRLLTPAGLSARLTAPLDVAGRRADTPSRHRTLRDTIAWSHDLLRPAERALLTRLAVFAGSFTVAAVEAVCTHADESPPGDVAENLFNLVDRNLVQVVPPVADESRFRLLQTVRDFALEQAREDPGSDRHPLRGQHAAWYAEWATHLAANSEGPDSATWLAAVVAEADNLRAAIDAYAADKQTHEWLQVVVDTMTLWFEAGHEQEGDQRLTEALAAAGPDAPARAIGLTYWAWLRGPLNRAEGATAASEAVELALRTSDAAVEAFALQTLGDTLDDAEASEAASRAVFDAADRTDATKVRYGPTGPDAVRCGAAYNLAAVWLYRSVPKALSWQQEALRRAELEGDRRIIGVNAARLAMVHLLAGDAPAARTQLARSRKLVSSRVTARWEDIVTYAEGYLSHYDGRLDEAEHHFSRVFRSASAAGRALHTILGAASLADLYTANGRCGDATEVLDRAEGIAGRLAESRHLARLRVRRARIDRLNGDQGSAQRALTSTSAAMPSDALPPERVVWLLESAEHARAANSGAGDDAAGHVAELDRACAQTGVHLPPWEERQRAALVDRCVDGHRRP